MKKIFTSLLLGSFTLGTIAQEVPQDSLLSAYKALECTYTSVTKLYGTHSFRLLSNFTNALATGTTGIRTTFSSQPGVNADISILGFSNANSQQRPTIVLDGMPYYGSLNAINPYNIAKIEVVKSPLYSDMPLGNFGDGIIEIETKKALNRKWMVNLNSNAGFNTSSISKYDVINDPKAYYEKRHQMLRQLGVNSGMDWATEAGQYASNNLIDNLNSFNLFDVPNNQLVDPITGKFNANANLLYRDNLSKIVERVGLRHQHNLNAGKQFKNGTLNLFGGYIKEDGSMINSSFIRFNLGANTNWKIKEKLNIGISAMYNAQANEYFHANDAIYRFNPTQTLFERDATGNFIKDPQTGENILRTVPYLYEAVHSRDKEKLNTFSANPSVSFAITKSLKIGLDANYLKEKINRTDGLLNFNILDILVNGFERFSFRPYIKFEGNAAKHSWKGRLQYMSNRNNFDFSARNLRDTFVQKQVTTAIEMKNTQFDWNGQYAYDNKYFLLARLNLTNNREQYFNYAFGTGGNVVDKEKYSIDVFANYSKVSMNNLYNNDFLMNNFRSGFQQGGLVFVPYSIREKAPTQILFRTGFESRLFENKLAIDAVYFDRNINNSIYPIPVWGGFANGVDVKNRGIELHIGGKLFERTNKWWHLNLYATHAKGTLQNNGSFTFINFDSKIRTNAIYLPKFAGVDPSTGIGTYYTKDGTITKDYNSLFNQDFQYMGSADPFVFGSLVNDFSWNRFGLKVAIGYSLGGKTVDLPYYEMTNASIYEDYSALHKDITNSWTPNNTNSSQPLLNGYNYLSDRHVIDASWLSLRSVMLSYNVARSFIRHTNYSNLQVYVAGENLLFLSARKGLNPNVTFANTSNYSYNPMRTVMIGVNIDF